MTILENESASKSAPTSAPSGRRQDSGDSEDAFFIRTSDGRVLDSAEFLNLPECGAPVPANTVQAAPAKPRRRRYTQTIEALREARKAKIREEKKAKRAARKAAKKAKRSGQNGQQQADQQSAAESATPAQPSTGECESLASATAPSQSSTPSSTPSSTASSAAPSTAPSSSAPSSAAASSAEAPSVQENQAKRSRKKSRANTGASSPADSIRQDDVRANLAVFVDAKKSKAAADAAQLRALAVAYEVATERSIEELAPTTGKKSKRRTVLFDNDDEQRVLSWHLNSIMGEFSIATNDNDQSIGTRAGDAQLLATQFPEWLDALEAGRIDLRHVQAMLKRARKLEAKHFPEFGAVVLEFAATHTSGQTGVFAEEAAATIAAVDFEEAHAYARDCRSVSVRHDGFGMGEFKAYLPSELLTPMVELLERGARELREIDNQAAAAHAKAVQDARLLGLPEPAPFVADARTPAQMRADLFVETMLCSAPGESRVKAVVSVVVPALSLLEIGRENGQGPALLDGMLPMSIEQARKFAADSTFLQRILTHPVTGQVTAVDKYEVPMEMRRFLQARDVTCAFPGCVKPAQRCDADHTHPYSEGGPTDVENLAHLCRGHHVQKHHKPWTVTHLGGGVLEWRTPLGQVATTRPKPHGPVFLPTWEYGPPPF